MMLSQLLYFERDAMEQEEEQDAGDVRVSCPAILELPEGSLFSSKATIPKPCFVAEDSTLCQAEMVDLFVKARTAQSSVIKDVISLDFTL